MPNLSRLKKTALVAPVELIGYHPNNCSRADADYCNCCNYDRDDCDCKSS